MLDEGSAAIASARLFDMREAAGHLAHLGFLLVNGSHPEEPGGAQLLIALRDQPTLEHFDPENIEHWIASGGKGRLSQLTRATATPLDRPFAWGTIRAIDRLDVFNSFLSFGGRIRLESVDTATTVAVFDSPAPIVRWSGHSQSVDPLTGEIGAFFARMRIPIDYTPGAEQRIAGATPMALYAAMLAGLQHRFAASPSLRSAQQWLSGWSAREAHRIRTVGEVDWEAGVALASDLQLGTT